MTRDEIKDTVLGILGEIAPEADPAEIRPEVGFRDQLDLDSMDVLNFMIAIDKRLSVSIPEADYPKLTTLDGCVEYLTQAINGRRNRTN